MYCCVYGSDWCNNTLVKRMGIVYVGGGGEIKEFLAVSVALIILD